MTILDLLRAMRARWLIIVATTAVVVGAAVAYNLHTTPLYESSTRLFVSTSAAPGDASQIYSGTLSSQQRVVSYTKLLTGEALAQRVVDKLHLDMTAGALRNEVTATAAKDTVLLDVSVRDASPSRARDIANTLSDEFVVLVRELETPPDGEAPVARVVVEQHASLAAEPVIPKTTRNIAIGLAMGLLLGIGLALLRDRLDNTVKDEKTLEDITGVGVAGAIPLDKNRRKDPIILFDSDRSAIAEAFRKLRTNLQFLAVDNPPRVILITSSVPDEGKSNAAINIALALAEAEHNVVLVDGDLRRPTLAKHLGLIQQVGFSTVLANRASLDEVLQKSRFPRLTVLASGAIPPNPSELLGSLAAKKILGQLRANFDYVIIDSSPLLAVTDAAVLAADADGILMMARYGEVKRQQLAHAVRHLEDVGASLLATVLTLAPTRGNAAYSYNYGYYGDRSAASGRPDAPTSKHERRAS
ncbi:polysaccharide biosynthesis tyrosine autokinase [Mycobacterium sp. OAE908]|uniref:polysaccharide biosynthesis tyrosine autokinase n=1 Tax=Mycobacterium sp. OAE908 TaxID=2817899 RepID=UPI001AE6C8B5